MRFKTMRLLGMEPNAVTKLSSNWKLASDVSNVSSSGRIFGSRRNCQRGIFVAATISLLSINSQPVHACGPFMDYASFVLEQNPDYPLRRYAAGELGIIRAEYARSYLVVAFRYLSGIKTSPAKQKEINALWERRLTNPDGDLQKAVEQWAAERKKVQSAPLKDVEVYKWDPYSSSFLSYNADAFKVATETLKSKIAKFGVTDNRVKEWVIAQDQVFGVTANSQAGSTTEAATLPALQPLPADADAESRADRNYQIACDNFYDRDYDTAVERFEDIGKDATSRWQPWADYLAARAYCRKGTLEDTPAVADLKKAEVLIDKVINAKDKSPLSEKAKGIKQFIQYRLDPTTRAKDAVAALTSEGDNANLTEALGDYTTILDRILEKKEQDEETPTTWNDNIGSNIISLNTDGQAVAQSERLNVGGLRTDSIKDREMVTTGVALAAVLLAGAHLIWWRSKFKGTGAQLINMVAVLVSVTVLSCSIASCAQKATTAAPVATAAATGKEVAAEPALIGASQVVLDDEMTNWILNFQDKTPKATEKAVAEWKKSKSLPWLVSAMSKIKNSDASKDELVEEANKVGSDSPAYLTIAYHRIRLLADAGKSKEASDALWSILKSNEKTLPPSARNGFYELGVGIVASITEFAKLAAPSPACVYHGDELLPEQVENLEKAEGSNNFLVYPGCLTRESANIINEVAPISTITALANDQTLPANVRSDIAQAGWVRSVLLNDEKSATTLTPVLSKLRPQLSKQLSVYSEAASGDEKDFAALSMILHNPGMRPYVTSGLPRETPFDKIDNYRDNWWCQDPPTINHGYDSETGEKKVDPTPTVAFLTADERKQGLKQYKDLKSLGAAPNLLAQRVLKLSKSKPKDPRFPEVLHLVVTSTRYGCTDDNTTPLSKQVFQELHKNYPGNPWTKKTKFWF